jgi:hypothetical protein
MFGIRIAIGDAMNGCGGHLQVIAGAGSAGKIAFVLSNPSEEDRSGV